LPTISGIEAIQNAIRKSSGITTSLGSLDQSLRPFDGTFPSTGIQRGCITEIYGPPGVGKTTLALQLVTNLLHSYDEDTHVTWIDTGSPLVFKRLNDLLSSDKLVEGHKQSSSPPRPRPLEDVLPKFNYIDAKSLPRLLTLFMHPTTVFPSANTSLIVIDDLSSFLLGSFPRTKPKGSVPPQIQEKLASKAASRRFQTTEALVTAISKLAAMKDIAVVVLNNTSTTLKGGQKAALKPALSGQAWEAAIRTRILLYRDFCPDDVQDELTREERRSVRFAEVVKLGGKEVPTESIPFLIRDVSLLPYRPLDVTDIYEDGLHEISLPETDPAKVDVLTDASEGSLNLPEEPLTDLQDLAVCNAELPEETLDTIGDLAVSSPTLPTKSAPSPDEARATKRRRTEIADSDNEDDLPPLPEPVHSLLEERTEHEDEDEMLLEQHERATASFLLNTAMEGHTLVALCNEQEPP